MLGRGLHVQMIALCIAEHEVRLKVMILQCEVEACKYVECLKRLGWLQSPRQT